MNKEDVIIRAGVVIMMFSMLGIFVLLLLYYPLLPEEFRFSVLLLVILLALSSFGVVSFLSLWLTRIRNAFRELESAGRGVLTITVQETFFPWTPSGVDRQVIDRVQNIIRTYDKDRKGDEHTDYDRLQNQINPHFLYNTLDSIRGAAEAAKDNDIADVIEALSAFFRYSISMKNDCITISDELKNVENYVKIQQYRFENRFLFGIECESMDELYDFVIPKLTLQPLVENAINHAFEDMVTGGVILISIDITSRNIRITVSDNGCGINEAQLEAINMGLRNPEYVIKRRSSSSNGLALQNVNHRLELLFGSGSGITVYSAVGIGTDVEVLIPKKTLLQMNRESEHVG